MYPKFCTLKRFGYKLLLKQIFQLLQRINFNRQFLNYYKNISRYVCIQKNKHIPAIITCQTSSMNIQQSAEINRLIANIDRVIEEQLHAILRQTALQQLRASWAGLHYLSQQANNKKNMIIKLLDINWQSLRRDLNRSANIEQSQLFDKIAEHEFGIAGGQPFSLLIGDYYLDLHPVSNRQSIQDLTTLQAMAEIAANSFSVFITATKATIFGVDNFQQLVNQTAIHVDLPAYQYQRWQRLRQSEASRFLGLVLPKMRLDSYYQKHINLQRQYYHSPITIWTNSAYAYASVFMQSFSDSGWFLDALGIPEAQPDIKGGVIADVTSDSLSHALPPTLLVEGLLTNDKQQQLNQQGFIALCQIPYIGKVAFNHSPSVKLSVNNNEEVNAEQLACLLPYLLCICRFAHYLKIIGREKLGKYQNTKDVEYDLQQWLNNYVASNTDISLAMKARYPLTNGKVKIALQQDGYQHYLCSIQLSPQLRTQHTMATVLLKTSIRLLT